MDNAHPAVWTAGSRRCFGELHLQPDRLLFLCLNDDSAAAAAAGQAVARQFGLVGALVGAAVGAARDASRRSEINEQAQAQAGMTLEQRMGLHPSSRTVMRGEIQSLTRSRWTLPQLVTSMGNFILGQMPAPSLAALEEWCRAQNVPVQKPKPIPLGLKLGLIATPFALVALYFIAAVPYAVARKSYVTESLRRYDQFISVAQKATAGEGAIGKPLLTACADKLDAATPRSTLAYVAALPKSANMTFAKDYYDFPRFSHVAQRYSDWGDDQLDLSGTDDRWRPTGGFGESYSRLIESPGNWSWLRHSAGSLPPLEGATQLLAGRVVDFQKPSGSYDGPPGHAKLAVKLVSLDDGHELCAGDLDVYFPSSSSYSNDVEWDVSQGIPYGLALATCKSGAEKALCENAQRYATLTPPGNTAAANTVVSASTTEWKPLVSKAGRFSVSMPGTPEEKSQSNASGSITIHTFTWKSGATQVIASYNDAPKGATASPDEVFDHVRDGALRASPGVSLESETPVKLGRSPGREIAMVDGAGGVMHSRLFLVKNRMYMLMVVAPDRASGLSLKNRYFGSFKLLK